MCNGIGNTKINLPDVTEEEREIMLQDMGKPKGRFVKSDATPSSLDTSGVNDIDRKRSENIWMQGF